MIRGAYTELSMTKWAKVGNTSKWLITALTGASPQRLFN